MNLGLFIRLHRRYDSVDINICREPSRRMLSLSEALKAYIAVMVIHACNHSMQKTEAGGLLLASIH